MRSGNESTASCRRLRSFVAGLFVAATAATPRRGDPGVGIGCGTAASSARVYGCSALAKQTARAKPRSTMRPSRITTTSSHTMLDDREVVADEQVGDAEVAPADRQQVEHLGLHRHVERADRLVGDDELRPRDQRARDRDALALAAGELVRVLVHVGRAQADRVERFGDALALRRRRHAPPSRPAARRRCGRRAGAGRASRTGPGTPSGSARARASQLVWRQARAGRGLEPHARRWSAARAPSRAARASTCRSPIRRRCRGCGRPAP